MKAVPPVKKVLASKHKFARNFHDITKSKTKEKSVILNVVKKIPKLKTVNSDKQNYFKK